MKIKCLLALVFFLLFHDFPSFSTKVNKINYSYDSNDIFFCYYFTSSLCQLISFMTFINKSSQDGGKKVALESSGWSEVSNELLKVICNASLHFQIFFPLFFYIQLIFIVIAICVMKKMEKKKKVTTVNSTFRGWKLFLLRGKRNCHKIFIMSVKMCFINNL